MPGRDCLVLERFFDESGGQQLIVHSAAGSRVNRALGLALRKRFCTGFGFELQAAANEEAIVISLGPMHSFELQEVFGWLHPDTARELLIQALLVAPMFQTRWRWNVTRSLLVERFQKGRKVPAPLLRFRADDALAAAFPAAQACAETLPPGPIEVPLDHPLVGQTVGDCLHEAMDVDGLLALLRRIRAGTIELRAIDVSEPSPFAEGILNAMPYAFLDDAPLEERRTQAAVKSQRGARAGSGDDGELDQAAVALVQQQCWPDPRAAEELHEALGWMGWLADAEAAEDWRPWLAELAADGRAALDGTRWFAAGASRAPADLWRGRLEAQLPVIDGDLGDDDRAALRQLEAEGIAMRARLQGRTVWGHRRLLARVRRHMVERLREQIEPVSQADFEAFLPQWQHATATTQRHGPRGLAEALAQLAGAAFPVESWEHEVLPARVQDWRRELLDQLTLGGEFVWLRLWSSWRGPFSKAPLCLLPRQDLGLWLELPADRPDPAALHAPARVLFDLLQRHGASFPTDLQTWSRLLPSQLEEGLAELSSHGLATCDSFAAARQLAVPPSRRRFPLHAVGRWSLLPHPAPGRASEAALEHCARALLQRFGVIAHPLLLAERLPVPWRLLLRPLRALELQGHCRGGRFVAGWAGEQFAALDAVPLLRRTRGVALASLSPAPAEYAARGSV
jgi:ATP-dependent Lhr-like helicase